VKAEYLCTACGYAALREEYLEDLAKRVSSNVDVYDNIRCVSEGGISYYLYEMTCPQCGASRGKQPLDRQDCVCNACYAKSKGSKGERSISNWLDARGIEFGREIQRDGLKFEHPLFFDFHLTEFDVYIEYDGVQHFEPVAHFGGEEAFQCTQERDAIKDQYCKDNNIRLIRISYKDYDRIEEILTEELTKLGVLTAKAS